MIRSIPVAVVALCSLLGLATAAARTSDFLYVHNRSSNPQIHAFKLKDDKQMVKLPGSPFAIPGSGGNATPARNTLAYCPDRKILVAESAFGPVTLRVAKNGSLAVVAGSPFAGGSNLIGMAKVRRGNATYVYSSDFINGKVHGWKLLNNGTLGLLPGSPFNAGSSPQAVVAAASDLFALNTGGFTVSGYQVEPSGTLTPASIGQVSSRIWTGTNLEISRNGKALYFTNTNDDVIVTLKKAAKNANTTLIGVTPMPVGFGADPIGLALSKKNIAVAYRQSGTGLSDLAFFRIEKKNGLLVPFATRSSQMANAASATFDPAGSMLFIASNTKLRNYRVGAKSATLSIEDTESFAATYVTDVLYVRR